MTVQEDPGPLQLEGAFIGTIDLGSIELPYVDLHDAPYVHHRIEVNGTEYVYDRSYPVKGGSAVMPGIVSELVGSGKQVLIGERNERYYIYLA